MNPKTQVLYVDDEPINLMLFGKLLTNPNYEIFVAQSGCQGLEILDNNPNINTVFSDLHMPEMNGIEFIKIAKEKYPDKDFILASSALMNEEIQQALESKLISGFIQKPIRRKDIEKKIRFSSIDDLDFSIN